MEISSKSLSGQADIQASPSTEMYFFTKQSSLDVLSSNCFSFQMSKDNFHREMGSRSNLQKWQSKVLFTWQSRSSRLPLSKWAKVLFTVI